MRQNPPMTSALLPHGGARNRHISHALSKGQTLAVIQHTQSSLVVGAGFNRFITVHWGALGVCERDCANATRALLRQAYDWLRDKGAVASWVWVRENAHDPDKGAHVHWLLHVPERLRVRFLSQLRAWVIKAAGDGVYVKGAILSRPVQGYRDAISPSYRLNLRAVLAYCLKGMTPEASYMAAEALEGIYQGYGAASPSLSAGGRVMGKRCGVSRALGTVTAGGGQKSRIPYPWGGG